MFNPLYTNIFNCHIYYTQRHSNCLNHAIQMISSYSRDPVSGLILQAWCCFNSFKMHEWSRLLADEDSCDPSSRIRRSAIRSYELSAIQSAQKSALPRVAHYRKFHVDFVIFFCQNVKCCDDNLGLVAVLCHSGHPLAIQRILLCSLLVIQCFAKPFISSVYVFVCLLLPFVSLV